jgi:hypothetical protein
LLRRNLLPKKRSVLEVLKLSSPRTMDMLLQLTLAWKCAPLQLAMRMMTLITKNPAEVAVEVAEVVVAAVVLPEVTVPREAPDREATRVERSSCPKRPSPLCDLLHRLTA